MTKAELVNRGPSLSCAALIRRDFPISTSKRPIKKSTNTITSTRPRTPLGPRPQLRLDPQVGSAPISRRTRIINK